VSGRRRGNIYSIEGKETCIHWFFENTKSICYLGGRNRLEDNIKIVEVSTVCVSSTKMYLEN